MKERKIHPINAFVIIVGALSGFSFINIGPSDVFFITWQDCLGSLIVTPPTVLLLCSLDLLWPPKNAKDAKWFYPSFRLQGFELEQPLNFMFIMGWTFVAAGSVGFIVVMFMSFGALLVPKLALTMPTFVLVGGVGTLLGVKLATIVFRSKMKRV